MLKKTKTIYCVAVSLFILCSVHKNINYSVAAVEESSVNPPVNLKIGDNNTDKPKNIKEIIQEVTLPSIGAQGRPLPLAAHWNTGHWSGGKGFGPEYQLELLQQGHHIFPAFHFNINWGPEKLDYYEETIRYAADNNLPISFIGSQWEKVLTNEPQFFSLPVKENPNVIGSDGTIQKKLSPFGPIEHWRDAGKMWTSTEIMKKLQKLYPNPPLVLFISNNEHSKLKWHEAEDSQRFIDKYGTAESDTSKRKILGDAWIERYNALFEGMLQGLETTNWKEKVKFIGYDAFGSDSFGRWHGWIKYSLYIPGRMEPWPYVWDGTSQPYYVHDWDPSTDFTAFSPLVRSMNLVFMLDETYKENSKYWFELSVWDGYRPDKETNKRIYYSSLGQSYSPARYGGMTQFGMWLLRPRVIREFRGWTQTVDDTGEYFMSIVDAVNKVYNNSILKKFWRNGRLVINTSRQHIHQSNIPDEFKNVPRWYLLNTNLDPKWPWTLETEIPVFSLALELGEQPNREWLVYAFAPLFRSRNVEITIPNFKSIAITAGDEGHFYSVSEAEGSKIERLY